MLVDWGESFVYVTIFLKEGITTRFFCCKWSTVIDLSWSLAVMSQNSGNFPKSESQSKLDFDHLKSQDEPVFQGGLKTPTIPPSLLVNPLSWSKSPILSLESPFFADPMCFPLNPCLFASTFLPQNPSPFIFGENLQFSAGFSCQTSIEIAAKKGLAITFVATDEDQEAVRDGFLAIKISWEYRGNIWYFLPVNVFHRYLELVFHGLVCVGLNMAGENTENRENRETRENRVYPQFRWMKLIFPIQKAIFGGIPHFQTQPYSGNTIHIGVLCCTQRQ